MSNRMRNNVGDVDAEARALAHELFAHECFAFVGEGPKPHSSRCEAAYVRLRTVLADKMGAK